ncbi:MAG TPA: pyridoxal-phosphate dependent enzyme [Chloroflexota bacterium]|nr:pyridoxal-phosphate dependent enzyme [Chloroflexota bacterium]
MTTTLTEIPITAEQLQALIDRVPRVELAFKPTPLEELPRLSRVLGGPRIFAKRDDLTGLAFGGNKVRNLEFRLAEAINAGADTVIMFVDILSNSARQTAAAANRFDLKCVLVLTGRPPAQVTGNLFVDYLLGAEVIFADDAAEQRRAVDHAVARLQAEGRRPFVLNDSPLFGIAAALAYAEATLELLSQLAPQGIDPSHLHLYISSTGKGQPGLELAVRALGLPIQVTGSAVRYTDGQAKAWVAQGVNAAAAFLGLNLQVNGAEIDNRDRYVGPGYGIPSEAGLEAMRLAARTDGLLLDPVYTSKAFAAIIDDTRQGRLTAADTAVYVHTGGLPLMFNLADQLGSLLI